MLGVSVSLRLSCWGICLPIAATKGVAPVVTEHGQSLVSDQNLGLSSSSLRPPVLHWAYVTSYVLRLPLTGLSPSLTRDAVVSAHYVWFRSHTRCQDTEVEITDKFLFLLNLHSHGEGKNAPDKKHMRSVQKKPGHC